MKAEEECRQIQRCPISKKMADRMIVCRGEREGMLQAVSPVGMPSRQDRVRGRGMQDVAVYEIMQEPTAHETIQHLLDHGRPRSRWDFAHADSRSNVEHFSQDEIAHALDQNRKDDVEDRYTDDISQFARAELGWKLCSTTGFDAGRKTGDQRVEA